MAVSSAILVLLVVSITLSSASTIREEKQLHLNPFTTCGRTGLCPQVKRLSLDPSSDIAQYYSRRDGPPPSLCGNLCVRDEVCPLGKKCCPTTCGYTCLDAIHLIN